MIKMVGMLKRRPGLSVQAFRDYYESTHRKIGEKYLSGYASRYLRRYLTPLANPLTGEADEGEFDVILEIWYPDQAAFDAANAQFTVEEIAREIAEDEERLFDRSRMRFFFVDESESKLATPTPSE
ncbi:MAG: EthD domain-containing protein [Porticoccaceae bacterium]|nr:EthD domain-containing protein [Porticoccaceae bacterium]